MALDARRKLIQKMVALRNEGSLQPTITLDDFFNGNTDERSIGVNLSDIDHIGLDGFRHVFLAIRDRPEVQEVLLGLHGLEIPEFDDDANGQSWPIACAAFVITSAPFERVQEWVMSLCPRDVSEGWSDELSAKPPIQALELLPGMRPVRVFLL